MLDSPFNVSDAERGDENDGSVIIFLGFFDTIRFRW